MGSEPGSFCLNGSLVAAALETLLLRRPGWTGRLRNHLRPRVLVGLVGFPGLELLEQSLAVGIVLHGSRRRRALFQERVELGARHGFDVVGRKPLIRDRKALPVL